MDVFREIRLKDTKMSRDKYSLAKLRHVDASLNYIAPLDEKPRNYTFEPPQGVPQTNAFYEARVLPVYDARPISSEISLDGEGFQLVQHRTALEDFYDEDGIKTLYYPEAEGLLKHHTGANRVLVFDHTIRRRIPGAIDRTAGAPRQPVPRVHNDYTEKSGPQRVRDLLGDEAESLLRGRFSIINVWRPIRGPLRDSPLAVCDARSTAPADWVASDLIYRDRVGETYAVRYNPHHRWFYAPEMLEDEAWLLKCYDSAADGRARFSPHAAFEDPTAPSNVLPRESIEIRALVFYPKNGS
jgi:hypothetical protein